LFDIHFWLGVSTSQDEAGTAAYKTVELDDHLTGKAVQHREVQDHESTLFISYFEKHGGIKILQGGIESGFHHVQPHEYKARLLWVKGKKNVRITEVAKTHKSMNNGDVFILDMGLKIYQWNGSKAGVFEKSKAGQLCRGIDSERDGKPVVVIVDQGSEDQEFWNALGDKGEIPDESTVTKDDHWEHNTEKKLWKFSDRSGQFTFEQIADGDNVKITLLNDDDVYLFDAGNHIYVWIGAKASSGEKKYAMSYAQEYTRTYQRPSILPISSIPSGRETDPFKKAFN